MKQNFIYPSISFSNLLIGFRDVTGNVALSVYYLVAFPSFKNTA